MILIIPLGILLVYVAFSADVKVSKLKSKLDVRDVDVTRLNNRIRSNRQTHDIIVKILHKEIENLLSENRRLEAEAQNRIPVFVNEEGKSLKQLMDEISFENELDSPSSKSVYDMTESELDDALFKAHMAGSTNVDWADLKF